MRRWWCAAVLVVTGAGAAGLQNGDLVAVIGDSITEQKQYSVLIEDYLLMCQPAQGLRAVQFGWGGETAPGFAGRMDNDMLPFNPNVITTCYGMNDGGYSPQTPDKAKRYHDFQQQIVQRAKAAGVRLVIIGSPGVVDADTFRGNPEAATMYNKTLADERDIARKLAEEEGVTFANVFDPMMDVMTKAKEKYGHGYPLAGGDGVHPGPNGHLVMAYAFLKAMGCDGDLGTISMDLAGNKAAATGGHNVLACQGGTVDLESSRYPFCFYGDPANPGATRGVIEWLPFNQDLNRLQLVVTGGAAQRLKVTWGTASKEFAAADLAKGINLAAAFLDNPFSAEFARVDQKVREQQNYETPAIKLALNSLINLRRMVPDEGATFDRIAGKLVAEVRNRFDATPQAVTPVRHTIKIEAVP